jgi:hypothetical protein
LWELSCVFDSNNSAALVLAALLADGMGQLLLAAVGAVGDARRGKKIVAAALGGALLGVAALGIRHGKTSSKWACEHKAAQPKSIFTNNLWAV